MAQRDEQYDDDSNAPPAHNCWQHEQHALAGACGHDDDDFAFAVLDGRQRLALCAS